MGKKNPAARIKEIAAHVRKSIAVLRQDFTDIYTGDTIDNPAMKIVAPVVRALAASMKKFRSDDCLTRASSLTYTIILSLIPALAVALTVYSVITGVDNTKDELFRQVTLFLQKHNISINVDPVFEAVSGLIDNAAQIGGISAVFMIFSATAMLRSMEKSFNDIWMVEKGRPILLKIVYYWAAFTLGPIMLFAGMTVATQISTRFSAPNYNAVAASPDGTLWVGGSKGAVLTTTGKGFPLTRLDIIGRTDLDDQDVFRYDRAEGSLVEEEDEFRVEARDIKNMVVHDIQFIGDRGWMVADRGILLRTIDRGRTWSVIRLDDLELNDIHMKDPAGGFIAADDGKLLATSDGGATWRFVDLEDFSANIRSVTFFREKGMAVSGKGVVFLTADGGKTWKKNIVDQSKRGTRYVDLNRAVFVDEDTVWLTGNEGVILRSTDGGATWTQKKFREYNYYAAIFSNRDEGFVAGDNGAVLHTKNAGQDWKPVSFPSHKVNRLYQARGDLWAAGDTGLVMKSSDRGSSFQGVKGVSFFITLMNFLAPFAIIWLVFLMAYISLPNIRVPFRAAAIGASITSAIWVVFILLFIVYVKGFASSTFAIYGALAAIPLFLLLIYASSVIVLFGAEVSYTLMYPETYSSLRAIFARKGDIQVFHGISLLAEIYRRFEKGDGASNEMNLAKAFTGKPEELKAYIDLFLREKLIDRSMDGGVIPANSSANISLHRIVDAIMRLWFGIPASVKKSALKPLMEKLLKEIGASTHKVLSSMTLKNVIDRM